MTRKQNGTEEHRIEQMLAELGRQATPPTEHDLRTMARSAAAEQRSPQSATGSNLRRRRWAHPLRWVGAAAAVALLVGSGVGFSVGSSFTSPESARASYVGTGFLPARGWTVVQSGTVGTAGATRAVAANVPLSPEDRLEGVPYATLESLPRRGVVILATFTTRGDPGADVAYPIRTLPLRVSSATPAPPDGVPLPPPLAEFRIKAGVRGTNVDARIFFGTPRPSADMHASAQGQLSRLLVASERITIFARATVVDTTPVTIFGSIDNGKAGEDITIQAKDCGSAFFRSVAEIHSNPGGGWSIPFATAINTVVRAVWNDTASTQIAIRRRAGVFLDKQRSGGGLRVGVGGKRSFWRKHVVIQRRQSGGWKNVKTVVLADSGATSGTQSWSGAKFTVPVPKGTLVRAVLPRSQAKPCYLPGVSRTVRT